MNFDVTLVVSYVLTVEADSEEEAREKAVEEMYDHPPEIDWEVTDVLERGD